MTPTPIQRALAGGLAVLGAMAAALAAAAWPSHPWLFWLAMPLAALARGQLHPESAARLLSRKGGARVLLALGISVLGGLVCQLLIGPLLPGLHTNDRLYPVLGLAAISVGLVFAQWRWWPRFGLLYTSRLHAGAAEGRNLWQRLSERSDELNEVDDAFFSAGIWVALIQLLLWAAPLLGGLWPADQRIWLGLGLLAALGLIEPMLRNVERAQRRPRAGGELPSFLLSGTPVGSEDITDPTGEVLALDLPSGPDHELLLAARRGDLAGIKQALAQGADPNALPAREAADQRSALIAAATAADLGGLRALIVAGADVNRLAGGLSALLAATRDSYAGRIEAVMTLLANGADANLADDAGNTPLHFAASTREPGVAQSLLDAGARLDPVNREGMTPLALACEAGNWEVADFLIKRGARIDVDAATPALLFAAAVDGDDPRGVKLLLKAKAKVNAVGPGGRTALMVAALADNAEIAEALMTAGAEVDAREEGGNSALLEAARAGANRVLRRLVFHKPDATLVSASGRSALHLAAYSATADSETVRLLLALGCAPDWRDERGQSAADIAASAGRWPLVRALDHEYPVPSAHRDDSDEPARPTESIQPDPPGRLLVRAAMQGRFPLFQELLSIPGISVAEQTEALLAALPHQDRRYAEALLDNGLDVWAQQQADSIWERLALERPPPQVTLEALLDRAERSPAARQSLVPGICRWSPEADVSDALVLLRERVYALGPDPDATDAAGRPALLLAVALQPLAWIERLIAAGANPDRCDPAGATALTELCWARRADAREVAPLLIRAGADPARATRDGSTPSGIARHTGQFELAQLLDWPRGAHPGKKLDGCAVAAAGKRGDLDTLDRLLGLGLDVDAADEQGATALLHAAGTGQLELIRALLDRGADPNRASTRGVAPLAAAILAGRSEVVEFLLARGVDPEAPLLGRYSALGLAAACLRLPLVDWLLQRGADVEGRRAPETPISALLPHALDPARPLTQVLSVLTRMLEARANPDRPDADEYTLLQRLLGAGRVEPIIRDEGRLQPLVIALIEGGASPNTLDPQGRTALHWACRHGLIQCGGTLLDLGADPRVADEARQLPIDLLSPRYRIHLGPALRQAAEAWNRQRGPRRGG